MLRTAYCVTAAVYYVLRKDCTRKKMRIARQSIPDESAKASESLVSTHFALRIT